MNRFSSVSNIIFLFILFIYLNIAAAPAEMLAQTKPESQRWKGNLYTLVLER